MTKNLFGATTSRVLLLAVFSLLALTQVGKIVIAQTPSNPEPGALPAQTEQRLSHPVDDQLFSAIYRDFYNTYRLGPADQVAIHVLGQPEYSLENTKVSPVGRIFHPLIGEVDAGGLTVDQLTSRLADKFREYVVDPRVLVSLLEARSVKIGVLGEVVRPGILVMSEPMTVLDAISASGGFSVYGNKSAVTLLRQQRDGRLRTLKVNVKQILEGKANPEANLTLQAGDTLIVHGNTRQKLSHIASVTGFAQFLAFVALD